MLRLTEKGRKGEVAAPCGMVLSYAVDFADFPAALRVLCQLLAKVT